MTKKTFPKITVIPPPITGNHKDIQGHPRTSDIEAVISSLDRYHTLRHMEFSNGRHVLLVETLGDQRIIKAAVGDSLGDSATQLLSRKSYKG